MGYWRKILTKTPILVLFIILISVGVGTASALITITLAGNVIVTGTLTADEFLDNGNGQTNSDDSAIGGSGNTASGGASTVGGGEGNTADGPQSTIGGGFTNFASGSGGTVSGGAFNSADGFNSAVGGGIANFAGCDFSTIPGGDGNQANGEYSFATGRQAMALHNGAIVFSDSNAFDFSSNGINEFSVRSTGGTRIVTDIDGSGNPTESVSFLPGGKIQLTGGTLTPGRVLISEDSSGTGTWGDPPPRGIPGVVGIYTKEVTFTGFSTGEFNQGFTISCDIEDFALAGGVADDNVGVPDEFVVKEFGNGEVENVGSHKWVVTVDFKGDSIGGLAITLHVVCLDFSPAHT